MIYVYNTNKEDHSSHPNNFYIGRGKNSILGNPFSFNGKRSNLAKLSFKTRKEALDAYEVYFYKMYEVNDEFKSCVDKMYELYKKGEDIYLQCFCTPEPCHGDFIARYLQQRLIKEQKPRK